MSTSNVKIVDKRKQKNMRKKNRLKQDADNKREYNAKVAASIQAYEAQLQTESDINVYIIEEVDRLAEEYLDDNEDNMLLQIQIKALHHIIDQQLYRLDNPVLAEDTSFIEDDFKFYPDVDDKDFNKKIYQKKEFFDNKIQPLDENKTFQQISNDECKISHSKGEMDLELSNIQLFIRNFISPNTPYNSVLLFHGVGVGKTCSAISIAEQFRTLGKYNNIFVLLSPSIEENFKKQLFDVNQFYRQNGYLGCTGDKFLNEIGNANKYIKDAKTKGLGAKSIDELQKKMNQFKKRNYTFMGYDKFASYVLTIEKENTRGVQEDERQQRVKEIIRDRFSNSIMIIDEAHHLRETSSEAKYAPSIIERVLEHSENMKLILLTATPMYDNPRELISLINLMLINDNKPKIEISDIFDLYNNFTDDGEQILAGKVRGYISYVRGENPLAFPLRLEADINDTETEKIGIMTENEFPNYDLNGKLIKSVDKIQSEITKIIGCKMSKEHYNVYKSIVNKITNIPEHTSIPQDIVDAETALLSDTETALLSDTVTALPSETALLSDTETALPSETALLSDTVTALPSETALLSDTVTALPSETAILVDETNEFLRSFNITIGLQVSNIFYNDDISIAYGKHGLNSVVSTTGKHLYKYNDTEIFSPDNIGKYSCKIKKILDNIKDGRGIIFIYTQFIDSGIIPLALALEHHGYKRYGNNQLLNSANKVEPTTPMGNYIMITSDTGGGGLSFNLKKHMNVLNSNDNINGEKIKIILGSPAASEGLSFLRVREIHILDPWHNFNRIEQAIGRGIRRCSHKDLPLEERNVTVYYYASIIDDSMDLGSSEDILDMETVDLKTYRIAVNKVFKIAEVEHVIKKNAIDCNLMKNNNFIKQDPRFTNRTIKTSKNKILKDKVNFYDEDYSRNCNYKICDYKCYPPEEELGDEDDINRDTFDIIYARTDINKMKKIIKKMYNRKFIYTMEDIIEIVKKDIPNIDDIFIYKAVDELMGGNITEDLIDKYNRNGYIIHRGTYYIFQPFILDDNTIPLYYRRTPLTIKNDSFNFVKDIKTPERESDIQSVDNIKEFILAQDGVLRNMIFERLVFGEKKVLYDDLVKNRDLSDEFQQFLIDNYLYNLITNLQIGIVGAEKDVIIGYRIGNRNKKIVYYCLQDNNVKKCDRFQQTQLKDSIKKPVGTRADQIGFMDRTQNFKDFVKTINISKLNTHAKYQVKVKKTDYLMKFSNDITSAGFSCINTRESKNDILLYLKNMGGGDKLNNTNSWIEICHSLEKQLRINDKAKKDGKRWFYTFEEAISLQYFTKKRK